MLTIKRTCTNRVITQAIGYVDWPLTAILPRDADAFIVYKQHPEARSRVEKLETNDQQIMIEICQETRRVLGLKAQYKKTRPDEVLELHYL